MAPSSSRGSVALVTLGCTRNEVDSEELAGRLAAEGWTLVEDAGDADVAVVNTCGFVEQAKKDSIDTLLEAADLKDDRAHPAVVAVGCLAERYGADARRRAARGRRRAGLRLLPRTCPSHLDAILDGERPASHVPRDRRTLLPLSPVERRGRRRPVALPGHGDCPGLTRRRPASAPRLDAPALGAR